jgi:hypothetical protein
VLEQNKNDAKENDGEKADYDLRAFPSKKRSVSHCGPKVTRIAYSSANKKTARRRSNRT